MILFENHEESEKPEFNYFKELEKPEFNYSCFIETTQLETTFLLQSFSNWSKIGTSAKGHPQEGTTIWIV